MSECAPISRAEVLAQVGLTLLIVQSAEMALKYAMLFVFPAQTPLTFDDIRQQQTKDANTTIGQFLRQLRNRFNIAPDFDAKLADFLDLRNTFIHHLREIPGVEFDSQDGLENASKFIQDFDTKARHVAKVFMALVRIVAEPLNIQDAPSEVEMFTEIDAVYKPVATKLFSKKPAPEKKAKGNARRSYGS